MNVGLPYTTWKYVFEILNLTNDGQGHLLQKQKFK